MWNDADADTDLEREQERYALARLLQARGQDLAAAIVGVSTYDDICVDNWNGGQYEAVLSVPPELYDKARDECAEALDSACGSLIGNDRYRGLNITVRLTPVDPDWVGKIIDALNPQWVPSERLDKPELTNYNT